MRHRPTLLLAAVLAAGAPLAVTNARADHPVSIYREPIRDLVHDRYDRARSEPTTAPALAQRQAPTGRDSHTQQHHAPAAPPAGQTSAPAPAPPSSDHQHHHHKPGAEHGHGAPSDWKFSMPKGDARKGRAAFVKFECYACHEVKGERFPGVRQQGSIGPELSEMAGHHDAEFFAEAIVNPNVVIDESRYRGPDGTSRMPSFNELMTVQELVDLVAFLKSLAPPGAAGHKH